jgi:hypothetical protein
MEYRTPFEDPQETAVGRGNVQMICGPFQIGFIRVHVLFIEAASVREMM